MNKEYRIIKRSYRQQDNGEVISKYIIENKILFITLFGVKIRKRKPRWQRAGYVCEGILGSYFQNYEFDSLTEALLILYNLREEAPEDEILNY